MGLEEIGCEYASCMRYSAYSLVHRNNCCTEESCTACFWIPTIIVCLQRQSNATCSRQPA